jgi:site-specific DNA-cytosine methylase
LAALGFAVRWCVLGADDVGAPHRRKRLWILAESLSGRCDGWPHEQIRESEGRAAAQPGGEVVADTTGNGRREGRPESAGEQGRPDAAERGDVADAEGNHGRAGVGGAETTARANGERWRRLAGGCSWWLTDPADPPDTESGFGSEQETGNGREVLAGRGEAADLPDTDSERRQQIARGSSSHEAADGRAGRDTRQPDGDHQSSGQDQVGRGRGSTQPRVGLLVDGLADRLGVSRPAPEGEDE